MEWAGDQAPQCVAESGARASGDTLHPVAPVAPGALLDTPAGAADDAALLARVRAGDEAAFGVLFARHWETVYRLALRLVETPEAAEDLAQETFVRLYRRPPDARVGAAVRHGHPPQPAASAGVDTSYLRAWLCRVAANLGLNALRAQRRRWRREETHARASAPQRGATGAAVDSVLGEVLAAEERGAVQQALLALPERQRLCLLLRYQGLSYTEVAGALGVAATSVGTLLARAEAAFRQRYLEQRGGL